MKTNNKSFGYYGEACKNHEPSADTHFSEAVKYVMTYGGVRAEDARNYLDSRFGRHLHDEVLNHAWFIEENPRHDLVKKCIGPTVLTHFLRDSARADLAEVVKNRECFSK